MIIAGLLGKFVTCRSQLKFKLELSFDHRLKIYVLVGYATNLMSRIDLDRCSVTQVTPENDNVNFPVI